MSFYKNKIKSRHFTAPIPGERGRKFLEMALEEAKELLDLQAFVIADKPSMDGRYLVTFSKGADVKSSRAYA